MNRRMGSSLLDNKGGPDLVIFVARSGGICTESGHSLPRSFKAFVRLRVVVSISAFETELGPKTRKPIDSKKLNLNRKDLS